LDSSHGFVSDGSRRIFERKVLKGYSFLADVYVDMKFPRGRAFEGILSVW
jgi:hypothetical protein